MEPEGFDPGPRFDFGVASSVSAISVATIAATVVFFVFMPRMEAGWLGREDTYLYRTGLSDTVDLAQGGSIARSSAPVMRVEFPDEPGGRYDGLMFWRSSSYDDYAEPQWRRRGLTSHPHLVGYSLTARDVFDSVNLRSERVERKATPGKRVVRQVVYTQNAPNDGIPALTMVRSLAVETDQRGGFVFWNRSGDYSVLLNHAGHRWLQYEALSEISGHVPEQLRGAPDNYREVMSERDYELLTHNTLQNRSRELVRQITQGQTNAYDRVVAISAYLSQGSFFYTLSVPALPQRQPVDMFLHEVRAGHCELFASAMALMVRSLGIPARVVSGYRGAEWSELDRAYTVREDMGHLWVEVYFIGFGWVTFDPSPPDSQFAGAGLSRLMRFLSRQALIARMLWYRNVVTFSAGTQAAVFQNLRVGFSGLREGFSSFETGPSMPFVPGSALAVLIAFLLAAAGLIWGAFAWLRPWAPGKYSLNADQARAVKVYRMLVRKLERAGIRCSGLSAEEVSRTVRATLPHGLRGVEHVVTAYNEVRFGGRPLGDEAYVDLKKTIKGVDIARGSR